MKLILLIVLLVSTVSADDIIPSINRGIKYLIENQSPDGSFGTAGRTKYMNIYAPGPGAHLTFKTTTSALCLMALAQEKMGTEQVEKSIRRCTDFLLDSHEKVRRVDGRWIGNIWAHAYIVKALLCVRNKKYMSENRNKIDDCIRFQINQLKRYQYLDGGWGYYDFKHRMDKPLGSSTSFLTATVLIGLKQAENDGFTIDKTMLKKGLFQLNRQRRPDNCFLYSSEYHFYKGRSINKPQGSVGRNQGCLKALYLWDHAGIKEKDLEHWVGKIIELNGWLDMGRKRPIPHESWYAVAGYFYYYGFYYAAENLPNCTTKKMDYAKALGQLIMKRQEKDGSWFDFPLYDYGHFYGTAYAIMSLQQCRTALN